MVPSIMKDHKKPKSLILPVIFPYFVVFSGAWLLLNFLFTLYLYFGANYLNLLENSQFDTSVLSKSASCNNQVTVITQDAEINEISKKFKPKMDQIFFSLYLNASSAVSIICTYSFGLVFHGQFGWKFFQRIEGGIGFTLARFSTWFFLILCLLFPWMAIADEGKESLSADIEFGSLCLISSVMALVSLSMAFLSVLMFDRHAQVRMQKLKKVIDKLTLKLHNQTRQKKKLKWILRSHKEKAGTEEEVVSEVSGVSNGQENMPFAHCVKLYKLLYNRTKNGIHILKKLSVLTLNELDAQKIRTKLVLGEEDNILYYLFAILQVLIMIYINIILYFVRYDILKGRPIQYVVLINFVLLTYMSIGLTKYWGKWQHGEHYKSFMLFTGRGGFTFRIFQGLSTISFMIAMLFTLLRLSDLLQKDTQDLNYMKFAGISGFAAQLLMLVSFLFFDKAEVVKRLMDNSDTPTPQSDRNQESKLEINALKHEIHEARLMKIFGKDYDYENYEMFKTDYVHQRSQILRNVAKFKPEDLQNVVTKQDSLDKVNRNRDRRRTRLRQRTRSPMPLRSSTENIPSGVDANTETENTLDIEEYEDENGNVFYFNVHTGETYQDLPQVMK